MYYCEFVLHAKCFRRKKIRNGHCAKFIKRDESCYVREAGSEPDSREPVALDRLCVGFVLTLPMSDPSLMVRLLVNVFTLSLEQDRLRAIYK